LIDLLVNALNPRKAAYAPRCSIMSRAKQSIAVSPSTTLSGKGRAG
jgi:hypothetical protein